MRRFLVKKTGDCGSPPTPKKPKADSERLVAAREHEDRRRRGFKVAWRDSAGLRFVEAPGQQCYRKVVDVMIISTMHRICFNSKVKECSCCTNNTCLSYCLQTRHVSTLRAKSAMISISVLKMNVYHCSW